MSTEGSRQRTGFLVVVGLVGAVAFGAIALRLLEKPEPRVPSKTSAPMASATTATVPFATDREPLDAETMETGEAEALVKDLPNRARPEQVELINHLVNLVEDSDYGVLKPLVTSQKTAPELLDVLVEDLMNRPDEIKLPILLLIARQAGHPYGMEARNVLEVYAGEDFGKEWARWEKALQPYLAAGTSSGEQP